MKKQNKPMSTAYHQTLINIFIIVVLLALFVKVVFL
ncbi:hypothetical protein SAMN05444266_11419 [Chitinophaga jiangningensis]|uniref:Uncharacterized protein n=1 Tax=Chitinophaga jiangningensis TaxID=1419482 RepID=A0A1M7MQL4_9BACT|nr:hypothetical protein SAMN05444266_11419 [Chitinophaga jiangningensis]